MLTVKLHIILNIEKQNGDASFENYRMYSVKESSREKNIHTSLWNSCVHMWNGSLMYIISMAANILR